MLLPVPGDLVVARRHMRAWVSDRERGDAGLQVDSGARGIVVQVWEEGKKVRLRVLMGSSLVVFSHARHCVPLNWSYGEGLAT